jgi:hypothetical protein
MLLGLGYYPLDNGMRIIDGNKKLAGKFGGIFIGLSESTPEKCE